MPAKLVRYWFQFEADWPEIRASLSLGCGVTAWTYGDAMRLIQECIFRDNPMPPIRRCIENVDISVLVSQLNKEILLPNMRSPTWRGIWFPQGFDKIA